MKITRTPKAGRNACEFCHMETGRLIPATAKVKALGAICWFCESHLIVFGPMTEAQTVRHIADKVRAA